MPLRRRLKDFFSRGADATLAVVLVLAFFLVFMVILWYSFPKGVGLGSAIRTLTPVASPSPTPAPFTARAPGAQWEQTVARLTAVRRTVKSKLASSIVWDTAAVGLGLSEHDAIQTLAQSGATIVFEAHQEISLGENSLIEIRRFEKDTTSAARRVSVVLLGGSLEGSIAGAPPGGQSAVEILAGKATAQIASQGDRSTKFRVAASPNDASSITVTSGSASINVGGRAVTVGAGQMVGVTPSGAIIGPHAIAKAPVLVTPDNGKVFHVRTLPKDVGFAWREDGPSRSYRIEVARDVDFHDIIVDRQVDEPALAFPDLPAGRYFWRVRGTDATAEGRVSKPWGFDIEADLRPPALEVAFPDGPLAPGTVTLRGKTEPGTSVFIMKQPVPVSPDGAFEGTVALRRGVQIVVVEAIDAVGNTAYASRTLTAR